MPADYLISLGEQLVRKHKTRDPFVIASDRGITIFERPDLHSLKGMYTIIKRNRYIFINQDLDDQMKKIVCAHELGHDLLHRHMVRNGFFKEFSLYDMKSRPEYEANIICSEILLDTDELLKYICEDHYTAEEIARIMQTDINLIALKIAHLDSIGHGINRPDFRSDFLK